MILLKIRPHLLSFDLIPLTRYSPNTVEITVIWARINQSCFFHWKTRMGVLLHLFCKVPLEKLTCTLETYPYSSRGLYLNPWRNSGKMYIQGNEVRKTSSVAVRELITGEQLCTWYVIIILYKYFCSDICHFYQGNKWYYKIHHKFNKTKARGTDFLWYF